MCNVSVGSYMIILVMSDLFGKDLPSICPLCTPSVLDETGKYWNTNAYMVNLATQTPCLVEISSHSPCGRSSRRAGFPSGAPVLYY